MKRILYVSQLADALDPRRARVPRAADTVAPVFWSLGAEAIVHDATEAPPPPLLGFDGVVVGGSFGSANDTEPWRLALGSWLAAHTAIPLLGICGGHQLLARALGGAVDTAPGPQFGVFPLELPGVPGFGGTVVQLHGERVRVPPLGAEVWAADEMGIQALRYGPTRWTTQFHPEMDALVARLAREIAGTPPEAPEAWEHVDGAVRSGRAVLAAWLAAL